MVVFISLMILAAVLLILQKYQPKLSNIIRTAIIFVGVSVLALMSIKYIVINLI